MCTRRPGYSLCFPSTSGPGRGHHSCVPLFLHSHEADGHEEHRSASYSLLALLYKAFEDYSEHSEFSYNYSTLLDAYYAPYSKRCRSRTGLCLLLHCILFGAHGNSFLIQTVVSVIFYFRLMSAIAEECTKREWQLFLKVYF